MHAWTVGVEDARNFNFEFMLTVIIEKKCLGTPFALVITGPQTGRVHIPPIILFLWVDLRVAVDLRGGGLENLRLHSLGQPEHIDGPVNTHLCRLDWIELVV